MPRLSHDSDGFSSLDEDGNRHKISIDPSGHKDGLNYIAYKARTNSKNKFRDPRHQAIVIAKFPPQGQGTWQWTEVEMEKMKVAMQQAEKFNMFFRSVNNTQASKGRDLDDVYNVQEDEGIIFFLSLQRNTLTSVSFLDKSRQAGENYVFEDKLKNFETFIKTSGQSAACEKPRMRFPRAYFKRSRKQPTSDNDTYGPMRDRSFSASSMSGSEPDWKTDPVTYVHSESSPQLGAIPCPGRLPTYEESEFWAKYGSPPPWSHPTPLELFGDFPSSNLDCLAQDVEIPKDETTCSQGKAVSSKSSVPGSLASEEGGNLAHPHLHAFVHHFFCNSNGRRIVSNLRGSSKGDNGYILSNPSIHSLDRSYGANDGGLEGMWQVIQHHVCSKYCKHLPDMAELLARNLNQNC